MRTDRQVTRDHFLHISETLFVSVYQLYQNSSDFFVCIELHAKNECLVENQGESGLLHTLISANSRNSGTEHRKIVQSKGRIE